jgi:peptidylprolyl isomerase
MRRALMRAAWLLAGLASLTALSCGKPAPQAPAPRPAFIPAPIDSSMMLRTGTGLMYRDLEVGDGYLVAAGNTVEVHYYGQLLDGTQFDANPEGAEPLRFQIGSHRVIRGWEEGLVGMRVGGKRQLIIPPALGYGARAVGPIPANATLVFTIEVVRAY